MTLPSQRTLWVVEAEKFLMKLAFHKGAPKYIKDQARKILRHYPTKHEMEYVAERVPEIFGKPT